MSNLSKQQAINALERIKAALRADNQDKAVELVQQIFKLVFSTESIQFSNQHLMKNNMKQKKSNWHIAKVVIRNLARLFWAIVCHLAVEVWSKTFLL